MKRRDSVGGRPRRWSYRDQRPTAGAETTATQQRTAALHRQMRRGGPPSEDRALYSCMCGLVFDEQVSTSVQCPHCGQTQAW